MTGCGLIPGRRGIGVVARVVHVVFFVAFRAAGRVVAGLVIVFVV